MNFTKWLDVIALMQCNWAPLLDRRTAVVLFPVFDLLSFHLQKMLKFVSSSLKRVSLAILSFDFVLRSAHVLNCWSDGLHAEKLSIESVFYSVRASVNIQLDEDFPLQLRQSN